MVVSLQMIAAYNQCASFQYNPLSDSGMTWDTSKRFKSKSLGSLPRLEETQVFLEDLLEIPCTSLQHQLTTWVTSKIPRWTDNRHQRTLQKDTRDWKESGSQGRTAWQRRSASFLSTDSASKGSKSREMLTTCSSNKSWTKDKRTSAITNMDMIESWN